MDVHRLTHRKVRKHVRRGAVVFYQLGRICDDCFVVDYSGRSDTCGRRRLLAHARAKRATHFRVVELPSPEEAYHMESRYWHLALANATNEIHPAMPGGTIAACPYCALDKEPTVSSLVRRMIA